MDTKLKVTPLCAWCAPQVHTITIVLLQTWCTTSAQLHYHFIANMVHCKCTVLLSFYCKCGALQVHSITIILLQMWCTTSAPLYLHLIANVVHYKCTTLLSFFCKYGALQVHTFTIILLQIWCTTNAHLNYVFTSAQLTYDFIANMVHYKCTTQLYYHFIANMVHFKCTICNLKFRLQNRGLNPCMCTPENRKAVGFLRNIGKNPQPPGQSQSY